jgi:hypothetical protein
MQKFAEFHNAEQKTPFCKGVWALTLVSKRRTGRMHEKDDWNLWNLQVQGRQWNAHLVGVRYTRRFRLAKRRMTAHKFMFYGKVNWLV